ncbi:uncharacterized protein [Palaemon carinicauda]|uniref:uncharacterized protein n=1 Tax=Palaemon carinicauda TaxID=392227 RepID=UPI0035B626E5
MYRYREAEIQGRETGKQSYRDIDTETERQRYRCTDTEKQKYKAERQRKESYRDRDTETERQRYRCTDTEKQKYKAERQRKESYRDRDTETERQRYRCTDTEKQKYKAERQRKESYRDRDTETERQRYRCTDTEKQKYKAERQRKESYRDRDTETERQRYRCTDTEKQKYKAERQRKESYRDRDTETERQRYRCTDTEKQKYKAERQRKESYRDRDTETERQRYRCTDTEKQKYKAERQRKESYRDRDTETERQRYRCTDTEKQKYKAERQRKESYRDRDTETERQRYRCTDTEKQKYKAERQRKESYRDRDTETERQRYRCTDTEKQKYKAERQRKESYRDRDTETERQRYRCTDTEKQKYKAERQRKESYRDRDTETERQRYRCTDTEKQKYKAERQRKESYRDRDTETERQRYRCTDTEKQKYKAERQRKESYRDIDTETERQRYRCTDTEKQKYKAERQRKESYRDRDTETERQRCRFSNSAGLLHNCLSEFHQILRTNRYYAPEEPIPFWIVILVIIVTHSQAFFIMRLNTTQYSRSFIPAVTKLWNDLPNRKNLSCSGVESPGEILSEQQFLNCSKSINNKSTKPLDSAVPVALSVPTSATHKVLQPKPEVEAKVVNGVPASSPVSRVIPAPALPPQPPTPVAATSKIFTPRTEEMNKGYLIFPDDQPFGVELKDEPDDLTHLAPSGGDTCVPLEVPIFKPELDDVLTHIPISYTDGALFSSPTAIPENILEPGSNSEYDEYEVTDRGKACNRLSGGKITVNNNGSCSPPSICSSPGSVCGLRTPEPPKPLISQAAVLQSSPGSKPSQRRVVESSRPISTTESLFTQLNETAHESYVNLELKVENQNMDLDEFDMRAPFIPLSNESLMLIQDDLMWGAHPDSILLSNSLPMGKRNSKYTSLLHGDEDSSLAQLLRDRDPPIAGSGPEKNLESRNPSDPHCSQYQQSKFLDGGGSFVDPNQVLPGHFGGKDGDDGGGDLVEDDPPQVMMHETVEPPPPLINVDSHQHDSTSVKRQHSPNSSPLLGHKKLCSFIYEHRQQRSPLQEQQQHSPQRSPEGSQHQVPQMQSHNSGIRELTTPYAPTMQQLLISKEPITVRGGRPGGVGGGGGGGGLSAPLSLHKGKDSVLRNLLVSGRDESAGYSVSAPPSPACTPSRSTTISPGPHLIHIETKGGKNLNGESEDASRGGEAKVFTAPIRLTQDRMTAMLLADDGSSHLSYPKLRILTGSGGSFMQAGQHSLKMSSGFAKGGASGGGDDNGSNSAGGGGRNFPGESFIQRGRRQDPLLLVDPDLTIPSLSELSQLDFEVNAPANIGNLLQGADLLMALDQA